MNDPINLWFRHDVHAASNLKHVALRSKYGWAGYGRYWAVIERLSCAPENRLRLLPKFKGIAFADTLGMSYEEFIEFIDYCCQILSLFSCDDQGVLSSVGVDEPMKDYNDLRESSSQIARNAANARWEKERAKHPEAEPPKVLKALKPHNGDQINQLADFWANAQPSGRVSYYDRNNKIRVLYQGYGFDKVMAAMTICAENGKPYIDRLSRILAGELPETVFGAGPRRLPTDVGISEAKPIKHTPKPEDLAELKKYIKKITELRDAGAEIPFNVQAAYGSLRYSTDSKAEPWYDKYVLDYRAAHPVEKASKVVPAESTV